MKMSWGILNRFLAHGDNRADDGQELSPAPAHEGIVRTTEAVDAAGAVDAENAPAAPSLECQERKRKRTPRLRAGVGVRRYSHRLPRDLFQTFLSGRI